MRNRGVTSRDAMALGASRCARPTAFPVNRPCSPRAGRPSADIGPISICRPLPSLARYFAVGVDDIQLTLSVSPWRVGDGAARLRPDCPTASAAVPCCWSPCHLRHRQRRLHALALVPVAVARALRAGGRRPARSRARPRRRARRLRPARVGPRARPYMSRRPCAGAGHRPDPRRLPRGMVRLAQSISWCWCSMERAASSSPGASCPETNKAPDLQARAGPHHPRLSRLLNHPPMSAMSSGCACGLYRHLRLHSRSSYVLQEVVGPGPIGFGLCFAGVVIGLHHRDDRPGRLSRRLASTG